MTTDEERKKRADRANKEVEARMTQEFGERRREIFQRLNIAREMVAACQDMIEQLSSISGISSPELMGILFAAVEENRRRHDVLNNPGTASSRVTQAYGETLRVLAIIDEALVNNGLADTIEMTERIQNGEDIGQAVLSKRN